MQESSLRTCVFNFASATRTSPDFSRSFACGQVAGWSVCFFESSIRQGKAKGEEREGAVWCGVYDVCQPPQTTSSDKNIHQNFVHWYWYGWVPSKSTLLRYPVLYYRQSMIINEWIKKVNEYSKILYGKRSLFLIPIPTNWTVSWALTIHLQAPVLPRAEVTRDRVMMYRFYWQLTWQQKDEH
jgi:hypothetical protein